MWHRLFKLGLALFLLPSCWGAIIGFYESIILKDHFFLTQWPFLLGGALYGLLSCFWQQPMRTYVFGHELSHALWVWFFRGKVHGFAVSKKGGEVQTSKSNFLIALAPYFFPIYSIFLILLYLLLRSFWEITPYFKIFVFFLGVSWGFHLIMTFYALFKDQEEVRETGVCFSAVLVLFLNVLILGGLFVFTSPNLFLEDFMLSTVQSIRVQYETLFYYLKSLSA